MITRAKELKITKSKLSTILTATSSQFPASIQDQFGVICEWCPAADRVIVHSDSKPSKYPDGLRVNPTKSPNPAVIDVLRAYAVQIPGSEVFALAAPDVLFNSAQTDFFGHLDSMGRSWAAYATAGSPVPAAFFMSAPVLPFILRDMPNTLTFDGDSWAHWMHEWMSTYMLHHRYFNADKFALVKPAPKAKAQEPDIFDKIDIDPAPSLVSPKKVGRPKKSEAA